ncbi:hypothetical protein BFS35_010715 [Macrococcoides goetzii]|uniref:Poly-beta-1,6-N-acetyl-D-glucosamine biosynthesis protein PgaD n=1 Tax=Macrococcoides goetzii TaxID=1891097 RepID=A0A395G7Z9_9STAP|nr:hypothetical protein [Macrococcus goetzii]RAI79918.1 hypothetical protein BFS35_010715 [Macrococcus goetzii]
MVKSRSRQQRDQMIIRTKKNPLLEAILHLFSFLLWIYVIYALLFFISSIIYLPIDIINVVKLILNLRNGDIIDFLQFVGTFTLIITGLLYGWALYNKLRYGRLNRRKYPGPATKESMLALNYIDEKTYDLLQDAKDITFETNPIQDDKVK